MRLDEIIQQHTKALSPQLQAEVFDFVLFLEQKQTHDMLIKNKEQRKKRLKKALDDTVALDILDAVKRRQPPISIAGKAEIIGDLTEPCVDSEDFECLK